MALSNNWISGMVVSWSSLVASTKVAIFTRLTLFLMAFKDFLTFRVSLILGFEISQSLGLSGEVNRSQVFCFNVDYAGEGAVEELHLPNITHSIPSFHLV